MVENEVVDRRIILQEVLWRTQRQNYVTTNGKSARGLKTRFLLPSDNFGFVGVERSLWRENGSSVYNCCWSSPAQSFLGPSSSGLLTIFYCLRFESPPNSRARSQYLYPPGTGWPSYTPRHCVLFSSRPTTRRVEVFERASRRGILKNSSQSQSHIATDRQSVSKFWCRAPSGTHDLIFITLWQLRSCFSEAPSLTRGRVCPLYILLALASLVFLGSKSLGPHNHILLSQICDFPFRRLLRLAGLRWRYSNPPPRRVLWRTNRLFSFYTIRAEEKITRPTILLLLHVYSLLR
jgi:hypothetical protein